MGKARRLLFPWILAFVLSCGGPPPLAPPPPGDEVSSYQLIDAALRDGEIDSETALAYKVDRKSVV